MFETVTATVTIESMGGLGDGIGKVNGKPLFVAKSCPGDQLEVCITHETTEKLQGVITRIIEPGPTRQPAPCPYFDACGGCTMQQLAPEYYRAFKTRMLHSALTHAGFVSPEASVLFLPAQTRRRAEFKIARKDGKMALAFHSLRSHTAIAVSECMVLHPALQSLIAPLNEALPEIPFAPYLYAVSLTNADRGIDMVLTVKGMEPGSLPNMDWLCRRLNIARISVCTPDTKPKIISQIAPVEMLLGGHAIALPPAAFLQATAEGHAELTRKVVDAVAQAISVVDLFCGIGTYSFPLSKKSTTLAIELDEDMVRGMRSGAKQHAVTTLSCEKRDLFKTPLTAKELARFDAAVINPPRMGAKAQTEQLAQSQVRTIVMVSCNPATFSRDAAILKKSGFSLSSVQGIDQFLWSQHLEIVAVFRK